MTHTFRRAFAGLALAAIAGCGDSQTSQSSDERSGAEYPQDRVVTGTVPNPEIDRDPTPQTGTGGEIPAGAAGREERKP